MNKMQLLFLFKSNFLKDFMGRRIKFGIKFSEIRLLSCKNLSNRLYSSKWQIESKTNISDCLENWIWTDLIGDSRNFGRTEFWSKILVERIISRKEYSSKGLLVERNFGRMDDSSIRHNIQQLDLLLMALHWYNFSTNMYVWSIVFACYMFTVLTSHQS